VRFTYILIILKEDSEEMVASEDGMIGKADQKNFVHGNCLFEGGKVLAGNKQMSI